jgi:hypothetical protein
MHAELDTSAGGQNADRLRRLASAAAALDHLRSARKEGALPALAIGAVVIQPQAAPSARPAVSLDVSTQCLRRMYAGSGLFIEESNARN